MTTPSSTGKDGIAGSTSKAKPREEIALAKPAQDTNDGAGLDTFYIGTAAKSGAEAAAGSALAAGAARVEEDDLGRQELGEDAVPPGATEAFAVETPAPWDIREPGVLRTPREDRDGTGEEDDSFTFDYKSAQDSAKDRFASEFDPGSAIGDAPGGSGERDPGGIDPGSPDGSLGHRSPGSMVDPVGMADGVEAVGTGGRSDSSASEFAGLAGRIGEFASMPGHISATVADETIPDGDPVDDPVIDGAPVNDDPLAAPPTAPAIDVQGHGMIVFGGGAANVDGDDVPGLVAGALARVITGPVGQTIGAFGAGWRAGRAIDDATGVGDKAVDAAISRTEAGKYAAEQDAKAAEAKKAADERAAAEEERKAEEAAKKKAEEDAKKKAEEDAKKKAEEDAKKAEDDAKKDGTKDVIGGEESARAVTGSGRDYTFEQQGRNPGGTEVNPGTGDNGGATIEGVVPPPAVLGLIGQPASAEVGGGRGRGTLEGATLPGALGNIDFGPDATGEWSEDQLTDTSTEDALGALGGSGLSISDVRRDDDEDEDEDEDDTSLSAI